MNKIILFFLIVLMVSCNSKSDKTVESAKDTASKIQNPVAVPEQLYACSMHPEVKGKKNDKCPKCGMFLTVPVGDTTIQK